MMQVLAYAAFVAWIILGDDSTRDRARPKGDAPMGFTERQANPYKRVIPQ